MTKWTQQEIDILKLWYGKVPAGNIPLNKTERSIYMKAHRLDLETKIGPKSKVSFQADALKILNWLYCDSCFDTRLTRKFTEFQEFYL